MNIESKKHFLTVREVAAALGVTPQTVRQLVALNPTFPVPLQISEKRSLFRRDELQVWIDNIPRRAKYAVQSAKIRAQRASVAAAA